MIDLYSVQWMAMETMSSPHAESSFTMDEVKEVEGDAELSIQAFIRAMENVNTGQSGVEQVLNSLNALDTLQAQHRSSADAVMKMQLELGDSAQPMSSRAPSGNSFMTPEQPRGVNVPSTTMMGGSARKGNFRAGTQPREDSFETRRLRSQVGTLQVYLQPNYYTRVRFDWQLHNDGAPNRRGCSTTSQRIVNRLKCSRKWKQGGLRLVMRCKQQLISYSQLVHNAPFKRVVQWDTHAHFRDIACLCLSFSHISWDPISQFLGCRSGSWKWNLFSWPHISRISQCSMIAPSSR